MGWKLVFVFISILFLILFVNGFGVGGTFSVPAPNYCGDNKIGGYEECDGINLNKQTCLIKGYLSGVLVCSKDCSFNESGCVFIGNIFDSGGNLIIFQCNDGLDNDGDGLIDYPEDPGCTNYLDGSELDTICLSSWRCDSWSDCINGTKFRKCIDLNYCSVNYQKTESEKCSKLIEEIKDGAREKFSFLLANRDFVFISVGILIGVIVAVFVILILFKKITFKKRKYHKKRKKRK